MCIKSILKNRVTKGNEFEKQLSIKYHRQFLPILISNELLKKRNAGQVDLCVYKKQKILIIEAKSRRENDFTGESFVSRKQTHRLRQSQICLANWFGKSCQMIVELEENRLI